MKMPSSIRIVTIFAFAQEVEGGSGPYAVIAEDDPYAVGLRGGTTPLKSSNDFQAGSTGVHPCCGT